MMKTHTISNDLLSLSVLPEIGGKIASLRSLSTGREWLWKNPHLPVTPPVYGASYIETMDSGGWDEIFPSVLPDTVDGFDIPDHGDLAALPWEVLEQTPTRLKMAVTTRFAPIRFERTLTLEGARLRTDYTMRNLGGKAVPYLWCAHPLIALEPGMTIELPEGGAMRSTVGVGIEAGTCFAWPHAPGLPALSRVPDPAAPGFSPFAIKLFTALGAVGEVAVGAPDGKEKLRLSWDKADAPSLGLWLNVRAWSGSGSPPYFNLGVEPSTAPCDDLTTAIKSGHGRHLAPGETHSWEFTLAVERSVCGPRMHAPPAHCVPVFRS